ncbi:hypothetical protein [Saccharothrix sp.]|uniref:hypothetical protein n=1 Tax=Saccharothrix sp. TaxID=1873460 RepID=UPI002810B56C|nr:hypothetical protein [Saccharothrix sp.]
MSSPTVDSYRELAAALNPTTVQQYLAANDWELESQVPDVREIWRLAGDRARIMLPLATDYVDFDLRFSDTLKALATVYAWDPDHLAERITATRADLFFVRFDQEMIDGTIPFRQAEEALDGVFQMMKAAATTAWDPTHSHRGRRADVVNHFLEDDVRLGHTKRGSFVFTVVTRLGDPLPSKDDGTAQVAFPRQVTTTLARGLGAARDLAAHWDERALDNAAELGLSASLVESMVNLTEPDTLRTLDLSFGWASAEPRPDVPSSVIVNRDIMAGLPRVRERLTRREEPPRRETLVGRVRSLNREEVGEEEPDATTIVLSADVKGRSRKVHIPLSGTDYDHAILAHRNRLPLIVTGDLVFQGRSWNLTGDITVDARYVQDFLSREQAHESSLGPQHVTYLEEAAGQAYGTFDVPDEDPVPPHPVIQTRESHHDRLDPAENEDQRGGRS